MKQNKDMKKIVSIVFFSLLLFSCGKQDSVYKEFVKEGGYIYPAKPLELTAKMGYQRIFLEWKAPMDPSIRTTKLFWDNYTDSMVFSVSDYVDGFLRAEVSGLDDRSYTFDVINYDAAGNRSLASEITTTPFGESWLLSHSERSCVSAEMDGDVALVKMGKSTDEMVATQFRYKTEDGTVVYSDYMKPEDVEFHLPKAMRGKRFEFRSAFLPSNGIDTVWFMSWQKSQNPIVYKMEAKDWNVTVTNGQVYSSFTPDKIFDGIIASANRWHSSRTSSTAKIFPKVLSIDTGVSEGSEYSFNHFVFFQSTSSQTYRYIREVLIYIGDSPYDPDDADPLSNFGTPVCRVIITREAEYTAEINPATKGRYIAIVFTNSFNSSGYIDLWELTPYGFIASQVD